MLVTIDIPGTLTQLSAPCFSPTHNPSFSAFICWKKHISSCFVSPKRDLGYCAWNPAGAQVLKGGLGEFGVDMANVTTGRWSGYIPCLGEVPVPLAARS